MEQFLLLNFSFYTQIFVENQCLNPFSTWELTSYLTVGKLLNLTKFTFSFCEMWIIYISAHRIVVVGITTILNSIFWWKVVCSSDHNTYIKLLFLLHIVFKSHQNSMRQRDPMCTCTFYLTDEKVKLIL